MLERSTPKRRKKHRLKQNAEKSPKVATREAKVGAPRPPRRHFELHRGTQSSKNVENMTKITDLKTPQEGDFEPWGRTFCRPGASKWSPEASQGPPGAQKGSALEPKFG